MPATPARRSSQFTVSRNSSFDYPDATGPGSSASVTSTSGKQQYSDSVTTATNFTATSSAPKFLNQNFAIPSRQKTSSNVSDMPVDPSFPLTDEFQPCHHRQSASTIDTSMSVNHIIDLNSNTVPTYDRSSSSQLSGQPPIWSHAQLSAFTGSSVQEAFLQREAEFHEFQVNDTCLHCNQLMIKDPFGIFGSTISNSSFPIDSNYTGVQEAPAADGLQTSSITPLDDTHVTPLSEEYSSQDRRLSGTQGALADKIVGLVSSSVERLIPQSTIRSKAIFPKPLNTSEQQIDAHLEVPEKKKR